ncbi:hypothetical protein FOYG_17460 [Fusarium oxysporum NRRL 32931]|uniref:alpha-galactosidase n=1 Tax=Fusarium oxysporum NRRL 32931 TaxID=660029 RepID=W9HAW7_FUSOX|nr:hypothetical protein FOYG_17460 [Fusarium oxysporum NRRL 32931]
MAGADSYVIDAGWHASGKMWWNTVGAWKPEPSRFPSGFKRLVDRIRGHDLRPGLWPEPGVISINSPAAHALPDDAFFQEHGSRFVESDRYHLDYRRPVVIDRMDGIVDNGQDLRETYGRSPGAGHLDHCRTYLRWVEGLLGRHPGSVIENCSSGGQRMDYAIDQQDPVRSAAIAASIPTAVTPEQAAPWAYPQPGWSD